MWLFDSSWAALLARIMGLLLAAYAAEMVLTAAAEYVRQMG